jgi:hypothetical protein
LSKLADTHGSLGESTCLRIRFRGSGRIMESSERQLAVVTGASSGTGFELAGAARRLR